MCNTGIAAGPEVLAALHADVADLCGALHLLADAAARRGDEDARGALRLLARHGEQIAEQVEGLELAEGARGR